MSLALYRKYRPGSFAEVKGQEHVTGPLRQALANGRLHHAYLFSGPRGCGKTSSARILARSLNCEKGPTPDPCGVCDSCVALAPNGPGSLDVIEIDAASHNGVDDARDLRDKAYYAPVSSRYKIYILDEAHMITKGAFNALLKLVEEPPEFVTFVFATTEPDNVIQTIRSRTHHYPFRLMARRELTTLLEEVVAGEGVPVDGQVLPLVVRAANGSARDALSILDQVLASAGEAGVTREGAAALLGVTPDLLLDEVLDAFSVRDAAAVFATLDQVMEGGHDPRRFAADVLERLRDLVILDAVPEAGDKGVLDCPPEKLERMARQVAAFGTAGLSRAADLLHAGLTEMRGTTAPRLLLELVCARVLLPAASEDPAAVLSRVERLERRFDIDEATAAAPAPARARTRRPPVPDSPPAPAGPPAAAGSPAAAGPPAPAPDTVSPAEPGPPPAAEWPRTATLGAPAAAAGRTPDGDAEPAQVQAQAPDAAAGGLDAAGVRRVWDDVLNHVKERKRVTHARLLGTQVTRLEGRRLLLSFTTPTLARQFQEGVNLDCLSEALTAVLGADLDVLCVSGADAAPPAGPGPATATPAGAAPVAPARPSNGPSPTAPPADAVPDLRAAPARTPARTPAAAHEGFAPGDEAADDDDGPGGERPARVERGEDAALRLVQQALGGKVVGTIGD